MTYQTIPNTDPNIECIRFIFTDDDDDIGQEFSPVLTWRIHGDECSYFTPRWGWVTPKSCNEYSGDILLKWMIRDRSTGQVWARSEGGDEFTAPTLKDALGLLRIEAKGHTKFLARRRELDRLAQEKMEAAMNVPAPKTKKR
jgi:hypothetical protein